MGLETIIIGRVNRLRVFGAVKAFMEAEARCPTAREVSARIDLSAETCCAHMAALREADGLPFPIDEGRDRRADSLRRQAESAEVPDLLAVFESVRLRDAHWEEQ